MRFVHSESDLWLGAFLGQGSFGSVRVAKVTNEKSPYLNQFFAVKIVHERQLLKTNSKRFLSVEKQVFSQTRNHPFICHLHFSFQTNPSNEMHDKDEMNENGGMNDFSFDSFECDNKIFMALDLCEPYNLWHLINFNKNDKKLSESLTVILMSQLVSALQYLHSKDIFHRDVKPENVLISSQRHIKLTDFGTCKIIDPILKRKIIKSQKLKIKQKIVAKMRKNANKNVANVANVANGANDENDVKTDNNIVGDAPDVPKLEKGPSGLSRALAKANQFRSRESLIMLESKKAAENRRPSFQGTAQYLPPEMLATSTTSSNNPNNPNNPMNAKNNRSKANKASEECQNPMEMLAAMDLWALGCVIFQCLVGYTPFEVLNNNNNNNNNNDHSMNEHSKMFQIFQNIENMQYHVPKFVSPQASNVIKALLQRDYKKRLGMSGYRAFEAKIANEVKREITGQKGEVTSKCLHAVHANDANNANNARVNSMDAMDSKVGEDGSDGGSRFDSGWRDVMKHEFFENVKSWDWIDLKSKQIPFAKEIDLEQIKKDALDKIEDSMGWNDADTSDDSDFGSLRVRGSKLTKNAKNAKNEGKLDNTNDNNNNIYERWKPFLKQDETIVIGSAVERTKLFGMTVEKFILLLTDQKRILVIDGMKMKMYKDYTIKRIVNLIKIDRTHMELVLKKKSIKYKVMGATADQWVEAFRKVF